MRGGAADSPIDAGKISLRKPLLPPTEYQRGIAVLLPGSQTSLGDGAPQKSYGQRLPFFRPGKDILQPFCIPPDILAQCFNIGGQLLRHTLRLRFADMAMGSPPVIAKQEMVHPFIPQTGTDLLYGAVPVFMMIQNGSHADNMGPGMDCPQPAHKGAIPFPPGSSLFPLIILPAEIPWMGIVLPQSHNHHLGSVQGKIPPQRFPCLPCPKRNWAVFQNPGLILHFIENIFHPLLLRLHKIPCPVLQGNAALGDIVEPCPQFSGRQPRIGIVAVGILPVMYRIRLSAVCHRLRHLPRRHGIPVNLNPAKRQRRTRQQFQVAAAEKSVNLHHVTGILPLEQQYLVHAFCSASLNCSVSGPCPAFLNHSAFWPLTAAPAPRLSLSPA